MSERLSCVLIVRNEEKKIERCLESIKWADEIILVDQSSDDKTVEIAKRYTNKIFITTPKLICNPDRNYGIAKAAHNWILLIEADEIIDVNLRAEIKNILASSAAEGGAADVYYIPVKTFFVGKWIKYCGWYPSYIPRFFKKGSITFEEDIHTNGQLLTHKISYIKNPLLHYSYDSIDDWISKFKRYTTRMAEEYFNGGKRTTVFSTFMEVVIRPIFVFLRKYIILKGFREGWRGLFISISAALGGMFAYFKLCELQVISGRLNEKKKNSN